jgi:predicted esterase
MIFTDFTKTADVLYGSNYDLDENLQDLYLDIYEPSGDTETNRPLVVVAHGGSFVGGSKDGADVVPLCEDLSRMGYVVASIQYRLGIPITLDLQEPAQEAVIRGVHDMHAAIRFFRKDVAENGNSWNIDPDRIAAAGVSAGAFITLQLAYLDEESEIPDWFDGEALGLTGGIEGESGNPGYTSEVLGIVNIAGALKDTSWIHPGDEPILSLHGTDDSVVPFGSDILYLLGLFEVTEVEGSSPIDERAEEVGLTHCFEIYENQDHIPHASNAQYYDTTRSIVSNFLAHLVCNNIELDCDYREIGIATSIEEEELTDLDLWPNPADLVVNVNCQFVGREFNVFDNLGQLVFSGKLENALVDVSAWKPGMYFLQIVGYDRVQTTRFVVAR